MFTLLQLLWFQQHWQELYEYPTQNSVLQEVLAYILVCSKMKKAENRCFKALRSIITSPKTQSSETA
jgi:hypothetical protein